MKLKRKIFILGAAVIALMGLSQSSFATCTACTWTVDKYTNLETREDQIDLLLGLGQRSR